MKTYLLAATLVLSATTVWAEGNPVQQMPMSMDNAMQAMPVMQQSDVDNTMQQSMPLIPVMTPEMQQQLMAQAQRLAAQEAAQAAEDTSNARINGTQRQQQ